MLVTDMIQTIQLAELAARPHQLSQLLRAVSANPLQSKLLQIAVLEYLAAKGKRLVTRHPSAAQKFDLPPLG